MKNILESRETLLQSIEELVEQLLLRSDVSEAVKLQILTNALQAAVLQEQLEEIHARV